VKGKVIMPKSKGIELKKFEKVSAGGTVAKEVEQKGISGSTGHQGLERKSEKTEL